MKYILQYFTILVIVINPKVIPMKALINWLLGRSPKKPKQPYDYRNRRIHTCDFFGKAIHQYLTEMEPSQRELAQTLLPALLELGSTSHPPNDFKLIQRLPEWQQHPTLIRTLINDWWQILAHLIDMTSKHNNALAGSCCPLNRSNLPAARAIVWLQVHFRPAMAKEDLPLLMAQCVEQYPYCSEVSEQLALAAANTLVRQPFYDHYQMTIALNYPILCRGRIGRRLQITALRQAS